MYKPYEDWDDEKLNKTKFDSDMKMDSYQNEYFDLLGVPKENIERLIELQGFLHHCFERNKEMSLEISKRVLETAFTPRLKSMLNKELQKDIDSSDEE